MEGKGTYTSSFYYKGDTMKVLILMLCINNIFCNIYEDEKQEELNIDIELSTNESYENIISNYHNFDFFSDITMEKINIYIKKQCEIVIEYQNRIFLKNQEQAGKNKYLELQNQFFENPMMLIPKKSKMLKPNRIHYVEIFVIIWMFILVIYFYYQRKLEKRITEYDENYTPDT